MGRKETVVMYKNHTSCRACGFCQRLDYIKANDGEKLESVFNLGVQPLANAFKKEGDLIPGHYPLEVLRCPRCGLAQLSATVLPEVLYSDYSYFTSRSDTMFQHFDALIQDIRKTHIKGRVLEIGSNDGTFLQKLNQAGYLARGVDPAANMVMLAQRNNLECDEAMFTFDYANKLNALFDVIIARHVFCHVDNWVDFMRGIQTLMTSKSIALIEVPYVGNLVRKCEFDTIYHEHLSYLNIGAMQALLRRELLMLQLVSVKEYPVHGGAIVMKLKLVGEGVNEDESVKQMQAQDPTLEDWRCFSKKATEHIRDLRELVDRLRLQGKRVAGLGASAKATVWVNACKFTKKDIAFITDTTVKKWYCAIPGSDIPVIDEEALIRELPDYVIVFCWNYREEILKRFDRLAAQGMKFIFPVPQVQIV